MAPGFYSTPTKTNRIMNLSSSCPCSSPQILPSLLPYQQRCRFPHPCPCFTPIPALFLPRQRDCRGNRKKKKRKRKSPPSLSLFLEGISPSPQFDLIGFWSGSVHFEVPICPRFKRGAIDLRVSSKFRFLSGFPCESNSLLPSE